MKKSKKDRIKTYLENTPNPYFVKCGDILIECLFPSVTYRDDYYIERYLRECLKRIGYNKVTVMAKLEKKDTGNSKEMVLW